MRFSNLKMKLMPAAACLPKGADSRPQRFHYKRLFPGVGGLRPALPRKQLRALRKGALISGSK
ncbi:MAG: hypothetical protein IJV22_01455 [Bacteroidales bacterium]|nr:hypothetical protein [Bacteroidales bacterium]